MSLDELATADDTARRISYHMPGRAAEEPLWGGVELRRMLHSIELGRQGHGFSVTDEPAAELRQLALVHENIRARSTTHERRREHAHPSHPGAPAGLEAQRHGARPERAARAARGRGAALPRASRTARRPRAGGARLAEPHDAPARGKAARTGLPRGPRPARPPGA